MKYNSFIHKNKYFHSLCFGFNGIFTINLYRNGFTFSLCHFGTNLKKFDVSFGFAPWHYQRIDYYR